MNGTQPVIIKENIKSMADSLRELKQLFDEGIITKQEFEKEKKKILDKN